MIGTLRPQQNGQKSQTCSTAFSWKKSFAVKSVCFDWRQFERAINRESSFVYEIAWCNTRQTNTKCDPFHWHVCVYIYIYIYIYIWVPSGWNIFCLKNFDTCTWTPVRVSKMNAAAAHNYIYIYIIVEKSPISSHLYDHGFMDNTNRQAVKNWLKSQTNDASLTSWRQPFCKFITHVRVEHSLW